MKTIRKNATKKIAAIMDKVEVFNYYTLGGNFKADPMEATADHKERLIEDIKKGMAKLKDNENGAYTLDYHSNKWIEFKI